MWTLEHGVGTCRRLQTAVEPFGFSVALYGSVLLSGTGSDLDVFLVPQTQDADVRGCVGVIRTELHCGVTGPFLGDWNRLTCNVRLQPDRIDAQFTRLTGPPDGVAVGSVFYQL